MYSIPTVFVGNRKKYCMKDVLQVLRAQRNNPIFSITVLFQDKCQLSLQKLPSLVHVGQELLLHLVR